MKFKNQDGKVKIETDLYIKPSNKQLFLDWTSNHPIACKKSIIYISDDMLQQTRSSITSRKIKAKI